MEVLYTENEIWGRLYDMFRNRIPIHDIEPSAVKSLLEVAGAGDLNLRPPGWEPH
jgi:hypothetical protein